VIAERKQKRALRWEEIADIAEKRSDRPRTDHYRYCTYIGRAGPSD
jgi:hypothetical protein